MSYETAPYLALEVARQIRAEQIAAAEDYRLARAARASGMTTRVRRRLLGRLPTIRSRPV